MYGIMPRLWAKWFEAWPNNNIKFSRRQQFGERFTLFLQFVEVRIVIGVFTNLWHATNNEW
jgi:hypothetical protein